MEENKVIIRIAIIIVFLLTVLIINPIKIVSAGNVGVKVTLGVVNEESLPSGLYVYLPIISSIKEMDIRTIRYNSSTETYTKDIQQAKMNYTVNYHLEAKTAAKVYKEVGENWEDKLITQNIEGSIKSVIGTWEAVELIENRQKATDAIYARLKDILAQNNVILENINITNIDYSGDFEKAVEDKVTAIQKAAEAKNRTVQVQEEANQKIIAAKAEAESMKIRSEALSQNQNLVSYEAVQKWNGQLPTYMMGNNVPFIANLTK